MGRTLCDVALWERWDARAKFLSFEGFKEIQLVHFSFSLNSKANLTVPLDASKRWGSCISVDEYWELTRRLSRDTNIQSIVEIELHRGLMDDMFI